MEYPLLAIDPGLNSLGWALWPRGLNSPWPYAPQDVGLIRAPRRLDLVPRALWICKALDEMVPVRMHIVVEYPAWHGDQVRKGWASGDMQKVCLLVGVLAGHFGDAKSFTLATVAEWKGQLPKDVVIRRLQSKFGPTATQHYEKDVWDAVGIGLWKLGHF